MLPKFGKSIHLKEVDIVKYFERLFIKVQFRVIPRARYYSMPSDASTSRLIYKRQQVHRTQRRRFYVGGNFCGVLRL